MTKIVMGVLLTSTMYAGGIFSVGHKNISITAGTDTAYGNTYTVMGIDAHYFLVDNISVGISYQTWLGDDPSINQITMPITYHIPLDIGFSPYVGGFYSRTMIGEDYNDYDTPNYDYFGRSIGMSSNRLLVGAWLEDVAVYGTKGRAYLYPLP